MQSLRNINNNNTNTNTNNSSLPTHHKVESNGRKNKRRLLIQLLQLIICFTFVTSILLSISKTTIISNPLSTVSSNDDVEIVHLTEPTNEDTSHPMVSRANNIIKNIMQGSNNAIVPRFKVYKRADDDLNGLNNTIPNNFQTIAAAGTSSTTPLNSMDLFPTTSSTSQTEIPLIDDSSSSSSSTQSVSDFDQSFSQPLPTTSSSSTSSSLTFLSFSPTTSTSSSSSSTFSTFSIIPISTSSSSSLSSSFSSLSSSSISFSTFSSSSPTFSSSSSTITTSSSSSSIQTPSSSITSTLPSSTTSITSSSTSQTSTTSQYSSDHGSYIVIGSTTVIGSTNTITQFHTITASTDANNKSSGISEKNKNIAIGVGVGIGVPIVATIIILILLFYRRKQQNSVRNYVDSNGRDAGIAVDEGNIFKRAFRHAFIGFPTLQNNPSNDDFDDDLLDGDELVNKNGRGRLNSNNAFTNTEDAAIFNSANADKESTGFVVNRPKPLRTVHSDPDTSETGSLSNKPSTSISPRVMNPDPISDDDDDDDDDESDSDAANYVPAEEHSSTPPPPPIPHLD